MLERAENGKEKWRSLKTNFHSYLKTGASQFLKGADRRQYRRLPRLLGETMSRPKTSRLGSLRYFVRLFSKSEMRPLKTAYSPSFKLNSIGTLILKATRLPW